ncbi:unnamed protein product [Rotaria sordida]|uniref:Uncharacterized protein n=1 Tax=Rotaria sordida TaxID=392033 RepID=A0A818GR32_9BILA|nr:unnamed protein product [Rotaria sordida]CAF3495899.1 unnamed protein product [Rotaria sordida]
MLPTEMALPNGNQSQMYFLSSNINKHISSKQHHPRHVDHHIHSTLAHEYMIPFKTEQDINNKMMTFGYHLQPGQYLANYNSNLHQTLPLSISLNSEFHSLESSASAQTFNSILMTETTAKMQLSELNPSLKNIFCERPLSDVSTQETKYENLFQPCFVTREQNTLAQPYSLPPVSLSSTTTSGIPPIKTKRNLVRTPNFTPQSQPNLRISSNSSSTMIDNKSKPISVSQYLSLYSTTNAFKRYQTSGQRLMYPKFDLEQKVINNCSTSNLLYNLPYYLTVPHEHHYILTSNPMSINTPSGIYSPLLPKLNAAFPFLSFSNTIEKTAEKRGDLRKSQVGLNSTANILLDKKISLPIHSITRTSILRRRLQKRSKTDDHHTKTLIKLIKQRNKLAVLKFMIRKRKQQQQQVSKKNIPAVKIEKVVEQMIDINVPKTISLETKSPDIMALNLKITFNTAQKIESISLYYQQRHKPEIKRESSFVASNNTINKLGLLIEAINFIETHNGNSKLTLESIE